MTAVGGVEPPAIITGSCAARPSTEEMVNNVAGRKGVLIRVNRLMTHQWTKLQLISSNLRASAAWLPAGLNKSHAASFRDISLRHRGAERRFFRRRRRFNAAGP